MLFIEEGNGTHVIEAILEAKLSRLQRATRGNAKLTNGRVNLFVDFYIFVMVNRTIV